jgi:hypothetical protein
MSFKWVREPLDCKLNAIETEIRGVLELRDQVITRYERLLNR